MKHNSNFVEHANFSVVNAEETVRLLSSAIPEWKVRGQGEKDCLGETVRWYHIGDDRS